MGKHYTNLSIQDVFRKIKADNPGYLLAFGASDVFEFRGCDAVAVHEALPDVLFDTEVDFKRITVHKFAFFPFCARLKDCLADSRSRWSRAIVFPVSVSTTRSPGKSDE